MSCRKHALSGGKVAGQLDAGAAAPPSAAEEGRPVGLPSKAKATHEEAEVAGDGVTADGVTADGGRAVAAQLGEEPGERDRVRRLEEREQRARQMEGEEALHEENEAAKSLGEMGFHDAIRNRELLRLHANNLSHVIQLLTESAGGPAAFSPARGARSTARDDSGVHAESNGEGGGVSGGQRGGASGGHVGGVCSSTGSAGGAAAGMAGATKTLASPCTLSHWETAEQLPVVFDYSRPRSSEPEDVRAKRGRHAEPSALSEPAHVHGRDRCASPHSKRPRSAPREEFVERSLGVPPGKAQHASTHERDKSRSEHDHPRVHGQRGREGETRMAREGEARKHVGAGDGKGVGKNGPAQAMQTHSHACLLAHGHLIGRLHVRPICPTRDPGSQGGCSSSHGVGAASDWEIRLTSDIAQAALCVPKVLCCCLSPAAVYLPLLSISRCVAKPCISLHTLARTRTKTHTRARARTHTHEQVLKALRKNKWSALSATSGA